jgi:hypothetical protein
MFLYGYDTVASLVDPRTKFRFVVGDRTSKLAAEKLASEHAEARKVQIAKWLGRPATESELIRGRIEHQDTRSVVERMRDEAWEPVKADSRAHNLDKLIDSLDSPVNQAYSQRDSNKRLAMFAKQIRDRDHAAEDDSALLAAHLEAFAPTIAEVESLRERLNWTENVTVAEVLACDKALAQLRDPAGCPRVTAEMVSGLRQTAQQRHAAAVSAANERLAAAQAEAQRVSEAA